MSQKIQSPKNIIKHEPQNLLSLKNNFNTPTTQDQYFQKVKQTYKDRNKPNHFHYKKLIPHKPQQNHRSPNSQHISSPKTNKNETIIPLINKSNQKQKQKYLQNNINLSKGLYSIREEEAKSHLWNQKGQNKKLFANNNKSINHSNSNENLFLMDKDDKSLSKKSNTINLSSIQISDTIKIKRRSSLKKEEINSNIHRSSNNRNYSPLPNEVTKSSSKIYTQTAQKSQSKRQSPNKRYFHNKLQKQRKFNSNFQNDRMSKRLNQIKNRKNKYLKQSQDLTKFQRQHKSMHQSSVQANKRLQELQRQQKNDKFIDRLIQRAKYKQTIKSILKQKIKQSVKLQESRAKVSLTNKKSVSILPPMVFQ